MSPTTAAATTVAASPYADNTDTAQTTVADATLATTVAGGAVSLTLPPLSSTTICILTGTGTITSC